MTDTPALGTFEAKGQVAHPDESGLRSTLIAAIRDAASSSPRSLQKTIGPSEVGTACARQLAYKLAGIDPAPGRETAHDPWASIVGTALHAWLADAMELENKKAEALGEPKPWVVEQRVYVGRGLEGSSDLLHVPTGCVLDWKALGDTQYRKLVNEGPSDRYRKQAHCYGLGFARAGYRVSRVALVVVGRAKRLSDLHVWSEPFDPMIAVEAVERKTTIEQLLDAGVGVDRIPAKPGGECWFCPFKGDPARGYCPGTKDDSP